MNGNEEYFRSLVATYIGGRVEFAVKRHFAYPPRRHDDGFVSQKHPNQYGHTRKLNQRYSASERVKEEKYFT